MITSQCDVVAALRRTVAARIGEPRFNLWFDRNTRFTWEGGGLTVGVPNHMYLEWLQKTFGDAVRAAAAEVFGAPIPVRFQLDPELFRAARQEQAGVVKAPAPTAQAQPAAPPEPAPQRAAPRQPQRARRWHRLAEFIVGPGSRVVHASALSVVEAPGQGPNPLVLHGPVGTGKTHLLEGIYAGLRRARPEWRVCYATAEDFTNRFVQAMRVGKLGPFRKNFRDCDAFLVDDLHFLAGKKATQEEFLHTFDALQAEGRQVVVTCDCHPKLADDFTPELTDRLVGGAVWGLAPPDAATRHAILRAKAGPHEPTVPDDVLHFLANQLRGNVRELEGALNSVRHYSRVTSRPVDQRLAREALGDLLRHAVRVVQLADVDAAVCRVLRLDRGALQSKSRSWAVSHPRMVATYLARKHTASAYSEIGAYFGGRNHSTAVAAEKRVRQWLEKGEELVLGERRLRVREVLELVERDLLRS